MFKVPEKYRVKTNAHGHIGSTKSAGNNGQFIVPRTKSIGYKSLMVQASDGGSWEHVSASLNGASRCPNWEEMCMLKNLFWDEEDFVIQMHVPIQDYVSHHPYCLHLWRKFGTNDYCDRPPSIFVGPKDG